MSQPRGPRPGQGAGRAGCWLGPERSPRRARPAGCRHTPLTWARQGAPALSAGAAARSLSPTSARVGQFLGRTGAAPGPHRADLSRTLPPPPPGLLQIVEERLREAPAQPRRDRRSRRSTSNSFSAGGATAPRASGLRAEVSKLRAPSPAPRPRDRRRLPAWSPPAPSRRAVATVRRRREWPGGPFPIVCTVPGVPTCRRRRPAALAGAVGCEAPVSPRS